MVKKLENDRQCEGNLEPTTPLVPVISALTRGPSATAPRSLRQRVSATTLPRLHHASIPISHDFFRLCQDAATR